MKQHHFYSLLACAGLAIGLSCTTGGSGTPTPTPSSSGSPSPSPSATPTPGPGQTPDPSASPSPTPSDDPEGTPSPTPVSTATPGPVGGDDDELTCGANETMVPVSGACDPEGVGFGCCPDGFPLVTEDCFCASEVPEEHDPTPSPTPTPPPFNCPEGQVLAQTPPGCDTNGTGWGCCPQDLPSIDEDCFCSEYQPPE